MIIITAGTKIQSTTTNSIDTIVSVKRNKAVIEMSNEVSSVQFPIAVSDIKALIQMGRYKII